MATIKRTMIGRNPQTWLNFAESLNCDLITIDEENRICISDIFKISIDASGNLSLYVNDEPVEISYNPYIDVNGSTVTAVCNPNFVWFTIHSASDSRRNFQVFYELVGGMHLYAYVPYKQNSLKFLDLGALTDKETGYQYTHNARLNFNSQPGTILYTSDALFQDNTKIVIDPNFLSCTYLKEDQIVVFNMKEFYSMSSHIVVPIGSDLEDDSSEGS